MSGLLIALCGLDASGKSLSQDASSRVLSQLGVPCLETRQPTRAWLDDERVLATLNLGPGQPVTDDTLVLLSAADRASHQDLVVRPALEQGRVVLTHRYVYSLYAYYMASGTVALDWMLEVTRTLRTPDLTILLRVAPDTSIRNVVAREGTAAKPYQLDREFVSATAAAFDRLADRFGFHVIDADANPLAAAEEAARVVKGLVCRRTGIDPGKQHRPSMGEEVGLRGYDDKRKKGQQEEEVAAGNLNTD